MTFFVLTTFGNYINYFVPSFTILSQETPQFHICTFSVCYCCTPDLTLISLKLPDRKWPNFSFFRLLFWDLGKLVQTKSHNCTRGSDWIWTQDFLNNGGRFALARGRYQWILWPVSRQNCMNIWKGTRDCLHIPCASCIFHHQAFVCVFESGSSQFLMLAAIPK